jgi:hypothetical protein
MALGIKHQAPEKEDKPAAAANPLWKTNIYRDT